MLSSAGAHRRQTSLAKSWPAPVSRFRFEDRGRTRAAAVMSQLWQEWATQILAQSKASLRELRPQVRPRRARLLHWRVYDQSHRGGIDRRDRVRHWHSHHVAGCSMGWNEVDSAATRRSDAHHHAATRAIIVAGARFGVQAGGTFGLRRIADYADLKRLRRLSFVSLDRYVRPTALRAPRIQTRTRASTRSSFIEASSADISLRES